MRVYLATDHAGFELKERVRKYLTELHLDVIDCGAEEYDKEDDYPDFIAKAAKAISKSPKDRAIIFGGSGQGEAMVANRHKNVRAAVYYGGPEEIVKLSREHNDANILSIGARFADSHKTLSLISDWLETPFSEEPRHKRRIAKF
ncbi:MAG: RpiB/LacA/LacB family sugar-phosphate isomerase [Nanoarchaeota archaeon]|nr:RpiB/LacA/LacB family sugar-phosphate isomerase [Nanoarchaeota archaeon]